MDTTSLGGIQERGIPRPGRHDSGPAATIRTPPPGCRRLRRFLPAGASRKKVERPAALYPCRAMCPPSHPAVDVLLQQIDGLLVVGRLIRVQIADGDEPQEAV